MEEYNITKREVLSEILKGCGKSIKNFGKGLVRGAAGSFVFPTIVKHYIRLADDYKDNHNAEVVGILTGFLAWDIYMLDHMLKTSSDIAAEKPSEYIPVFLATNVASLAYEVGKSVYHHARQRVLEKHKAEGIEAAVETAEPAQE